MPNRQEYASYVMYEGYPRWRDQISNKRLFVYQLTAIMVGENPYDVFDPNMCIHHKNGIKFDNRPTNLELMSKSQHSKHHYTKIEENQVITSDGCNYIIEEYGNKPLDKLANELGVSISGVWRHLSGNCNHHNTDYTKGYEGPREGEWRDYEVFYKEYVVNNRTLDDLADEWDCSLGTVANWKEKHGIEHNNR